MSLVTTRHALHRVAAHVLGRRRFQVGGRFGLRASPGGFATPAFGDGPEALRVTGTYLVREVAGEASLLSMDGASLAELASFAGADLLVPFAPGADGPGPGATDEPLELGAEEVRRIADWFELGWRVLDDVLAGLPADAAPATVQLWPEHFDAGTNVGLPGGDRVNLGFSAGDGYEPEPYAYVGPWGEERHGDPGFWNAPFGAVLRSAEVLAAAAPARTGADFLRAGIRQATARA